MSILLKKKKNRSSQIFQEEEASKKLNIISRILAKEKQTNTKNNGATDKLLQWNGNWSRYYSKFLTTIKDVKDEEIQKKGQKSGSQVLGLGQRARRESKQLHSVKSKQNRRNGG